MAFPPSTSRSFCILLLSLFGRQIKRFGDPVNRPKPMVLGLTCPIFFILRYPLLFSGKWIIIDPDRSRNLKNPLQFPYHIDGQFFLSVQDLRYAAFSADDSDQVLLAHIQLLHPYFYRFDRVRRFDRIMLVFIVFYEQ